MENELLNVQRLPNQTIFLYLFAVSWAPACLTWSRLNKHLAPFLQWSLTGHILCVQWKDDMLKKAVSERYAQRKRWANQMLFDYYNVSTEEYGRMENNLKVYIFNLNEYLYF